MCFVECVAKYLSSNVYQRKGVLNDHQCIYIYKFFFSEELARGRGAQRRRFHANFIARKRGEYTALRRGQAELESRLSNQATGRLTGLLSRRVWDSKRRSRNVSCDLWLDSYAV